MICRALADLPDDLPFDQAAIIPDAVFIPQAAIVAAAQVRPRAIGGSLGFRGWLTWFMRLAEVGCVVAGPFGECQCGAAQDLGHRVGGQLGGQRGHAPAVLEDALDDRPG
jgi:hypothetical protein